MCPRLEQPWIYRDPPPPLVESETGDILEFDVRGSQRECENEYQQEASGSGANRDARGATVSSNSSSSVSLGDTHIWRS
jgi:calcium permeable stress-gated cation channel